MRESAVPSAAKSIYEQSSFALWDAGLSAKVASMCSIPKAQSYDPVIFSRKSSGKRSRISAGSRS
jgi:hypothetical protein